MLYAVEALLFGLHPALPVEAFEGLGDLLQGQRTCTEDDLMVVFVVAQVKADDALMVLAQKADDIAIKVEEVANIEDKAD